ncbi:RAD51-associated protein 1 [Syngnathoides biaculeatus]|uniref:RAD51-associated protein 1 n=1 Tax=Syngnathoides biaculeatus TaxID=300417 RepID=UPI002ADE097C|nr:RAD51-associated protein 1 [Syngnathoides biaculeatus]
MDRPARKTKSVNYCESKDIDDDDEDFACAKPPPGKKAKQERGNTSSHGSRKAPDEKLLTRHLEAAIALSLLTDGHAGGTREAPPAGRGDENTDPASLHRSNCSVDPSLFGLDEISQADVRKEQRIGPPDGDYEPKLTAESESEEDEEEEEFAGNEKSRKKKGGDRRRRPVGKQERQPPKLKAQPRTVSATATPGSPLALKPAVTKVRASFSPTGSRIPKWNPPGQIGKSPPSSQSPPTRCPGQGLRLGLSRRVRVKPLHPSSAAT